MIADEVLKFLNGEGPLKGAWFGDSPPTGETGAFWWRKYLRALADPALAELDAKATQGKWTFKSGGYIEAGTDTILGSDEYYPWVPDENTIEFIVALVNAYRKSKGGV